MTRSSVTIEEWRPSAITWPSAMTTTQSLIVRTTSMSCSTNTTDRPSAARSCTWLTIVWARAGFTPAIGSSSITRSGWTMRARAISSSLRWPPDSDPANSSRMWVRLNRASRPSARSSLAVSWSRHRGRSSELKNRSPVWPLAPSFMFSITVRRDSALVSWKVRTMPFCATRWAGSPRRGLPSSDHTPVLGLSKPVSRLNSVVLPAPFGPIRPVMTPRWNSMWSTLTALRRPKRRVSPSATRMGSVLRAPGSSGTPSNASTLIFVNPEVAPVWVVSVIARSPGRQGDLSPVAEDALWPEHHEQDEAQAHEHEPHLADLHPAQDAVGDLVVLDRLPQHVLAERHEHPEDHRADDRPPDRGGAAEDEAGVGEEGRGRAVVVGLDRAGRDRQHHARQRPDHAADDQALHLVGV